MEVVLLSKRGGKREGAGRIPPAGERRRIRSIKFADAEWESIQEKAKELGITASEYIRQKALQNK
jgi:hypothetical protein